MAFFVNTRLQTSGSYSTALRVLFGVFCSSAVLGQYYSPPMANMGGAIGCVVTGNKLFSHGNYIRDLNTEELHELDKYRRELIEFKEKVDAAYANLDAIMQKNGTLPVIPNRPIMPGFCVSNETTLYILGGCTVQNHKVYIGGKFARDLNEKEKVQLDQFAKQMMAANLAAAQQAAAAQAAAQAATGASNATSPLAADAPPMHSMPSASGMPSTTTISPVTDAGRQIALDFCTEF
ncbi:pepsin inhibitor-3-like repeated domain-containing protein [Ditylenchus destructor]|uniref:Pepsin inhibitor-3-like repeated domain-containing protein n=1 Tax=Ditylenchus destructor TaxID=166010 RepID=A0AAD4MRS4_9BILA|nr:pepsin inhibitor-3-like repeated domain-containing protein [Ditylenchus destructor]